METGKVVAFFEQKKIFCAVCLEVKENKSLCGTLIKIIKFFPPALL